MDHAQQSKGSTLRYREHGDESLDKRPADSSASLTDAKRLIRRVRSPSRPRAWLSNSYKPKFEERFHRPHFPREDHSFYKPGFANQRHHQFSPQGHSHRRDHFHPIDPRERERYDQREGGDGGSPPKQNNPSRPFVPRSSSSRDKDAQFTTDRNQSWQRDHTGAKGSERERSREGDPPSTASQTATRDRAIQKKRREIDEVYYQECEMFGLVAKMLIAKDPTLELSIQSALQENLRDIGKRCVEGMEKFIEDYDSRETPPR
ncbi:periphilin-1 [Cyclopterus lumpus]|uniref:Periphilin-1 C-terminal domain-containing protein n=1 Tax=Cyclopterus lumpus TaxID=8103 RepID=A0A8C2YZ05_CYCLU|nr:periphilin-1 [Cyclopterus lumpus]